MVEVFYRESELVLSVNKKEIVFNTVSENVLLDTFEVSYPWEYEKSWILLEVKEYSGKLFYNFLAEGNHIVIITWDSFELKEEILSFFWDIDILIIVWSKPATKIFENVEAKVVIPYGEGKDLFLTTLWQHIEEVSNYKIKAEKSLDMTEFVNLA